MKTKILRNIFISVGVLFVSARLLTAGTSDQVPNFNDMPLGSAPPVIMTFEAPGAGTGPMQGTIAQAINQAGKIVGYFFTPSPVTRGFVRDPDGITFHEFDAPGGGTGPYQGTFVTAIDDAAGAITGFVRDSSDAFHGYERMPDGTFIGPFDARDAGTGRFQGTEPSNINATGVITGTYVDPSNVNHGFVRDADGTIHEFDALGAGTGPGQGTGTGGVDCLTDAGATVGEYLDSSNVWHGFLRDPDGTIHEFDAPGAGTGPHQGTEPGGINAAGTIIVLLIDMNDVTHGAERAPDGTFAPPFDAPGAGTGPGQGTFPENINASGAITGWYIDSSNVNHGFLRASDGTITTFDAWSLATQSQKCLLRCQI